MVTSMFQILPYTPGDFHVSKVGIEYITVEWTSNFNGGYPQMFDIYVMIVGDDGWEPGILNISDVGQGTRMECIIGELMPNTEYILRLDVSNKLGSGHSTQLRYWTLAPPRITVLRFQCETYIHLFQVRGTLISVTPPEADRCDIMVDINSNTTTEVILLYEQQTVARAEATHTAGTYRIHLNNLRCNQTGEYIVRASKSFRDNSDDAYRYDQPFELRVACSPRILSTSNRTIGLTSGRYNTVPINVTVIANPSPSFDWSEGVSSLPVLKTNLYTYIIRGIVEAKTVTEYREDHVNITNGLGQVLTVTFQIRPEGVPQTPTDFRVAKVGVNSITVTWTSVFDGGYLQIFDIYIMAVEDVGWRPGVLGIPDPGQGTLMEHTIGNLTSYTEYILRLGVSNKLGSGNSTQLRYWTLDVPQKIFKLPFIILTVSLGILIIATIIIIIRITTHQKAKQVKDRCPDQGPTINHALHPITDPSNSNHDHVYASVDGEVSVQTTGTRHRAETEEITRHQYFYASVNEGSLNSRTRNLHGNEDDTAVATDGDRQYLEIIEMRGSEDDTATATAGERQYLEIIEMKESEGGADSFHYLQMDKPKDNIDGMSLDADMQYIEMGASEGGTKVLTASDTNDIMYDREEEKRHLYLKPKAPRPVTNIKTSDEEDNTEVKVPVGDGNEYTKLKIPRGGAHLYGVPLAQLEANSAIPDVDTEEGMTETLTNQKGDSDSDYDEAVSK
ncbi:uncharacterized protein [Argopecten irradians]|uniref:uncharacterized protein n=1 Tax=Argopecten irradians TaxID=31199 RepID=UPI0037184DFD